MNSSYEEDDFYLEQSHSSFDTQTSMVRASEIKQGDVFILNEKEIIQVDSVRKTGSRHKSEIDIQGRNLKNNLIFSQYKFGQSQSLKRIQDVQIKDYRIVAFEPEDGIIHVVGDSSGIIEVRVEQKMSEFELISPNISRIRAKCIYYDGSLDLLGFFCQNQGESIV